MLPQTVAVVVETKRQWQNKNIEDLFVPIQPQYKRKGLVVSSVTNGQKMDQQVLSTDGAPATIVSPVFYLAVLR